MDINNITDIIEFQYTLKRRIKHPSFVATAKNKEDFKKAAQVCIDEEYDPQAFVSAIYNHYENSGIEFYSKLLINGNCKAIYADSLVVDGLTVKDVFDTNKDYLRSQLENNGRSVEDVLMDDMLPLQAWFRIVITKEPNPYVIRKYLHLARQECKVYGDDINELCKKFGLDFRRLV